MSISCRFCKHELKDLMLSLGMSPLANSYLKKADLNKMEPTFPLDVYICNRCFLVQLSEYESPENIFSDYAYFSSYSDILLNHAREYAQMIIKRIRLDRHSLVVEVASNDGYLLKNFVAQGIPVLGIEPAENIATAARSKGVPTDVKFFGKATAQTMAQKGQLADLLIGNNVLAHVPDLNDFVEGMKLALKPQGVITMEFPHLLCLMENVQFDTIYHEHFSYFSFLTVDQVFTAHGLEIFDCEAIPTHGGSLRIYAKHKNDNSKSVLARVHSLGDRERDKGLDRLDTYLHFQDKVNANKLAIIQFFVDSKRAGKKIAGYGAAAKAVTLLNFCGIGKDFIDFIADRSPHKQDCYLPGSHIPIVHPDRIKSTKPDYIFIPAWNLQEEIIQQLSFARDWGGKFVVPIPQLEVIG